MEFLRKLKTKLGLEEKTEHDINMDNRSEIVKNLVIRLKDRGFSRSEINEVTDILKKSESEIAVLKEKLIGTNINVLDPTQIMNPIMEEIKQKQLQCGIEMKAKIAEIVKRKQKEL